MTNPANSTNDGRESVWDYPRPPRCEFSTRRIKVVFGGVTVVESSRAVRVLETSHPPTYYLPPGDIADGVLIPTERMSVCEWKGAARYFHLKVGDFTAENAAWAYPHPTKAFESIQDYVAFYPHLLDACFVDDERVQPQFGGFYGGWITSEIQGPFKGPPDTLGW